MSRARRSDADSTHVRQGAATPPSAFSQVRDSGPPFLKLQRSELPRQTQLGITPDTCHCLTQIRLVIAVKNIINRQPHFRAAPETLRAIPRSKQGMQRIACRWRQAVEAALRQDTVLPGDEAALPAQARALVG